MEFIQVFSGIAMVMVAVVAILGLVSTWNTAYNDNLGEEEGFNNTLANVQTLIDDNLVKKGVDYGDSTQQEAGAGSEPTQESNMRKRALRSIGLIDNLIGLVPALIKDFAAQLNIPQVYWRIAEALFWIVFSITLAFLFLLGVRKLVGDG